MNSSPPVHLCIVQPKGYLHSLAFLDPALYVRHQLSRLGVSVTLGKNRLREDAVNVIFGAHLGFDTARLSRHVGVVFNLEQLGPGGAHVGPGYLNLLRSLPAADYDIANVEALGAGSHPVDVLPFLHAANLEPSGVQPTSERPIDLLFFGSMNDRRKRFIERVERCGVPVSIPDRPLYGPERDQLIGQAKAVLNCHFYDSARLERIRIQQCLSLGTPVLCERVDGNIIDPAFESCVNWLTDDGLEGFLVDVFRSSRFEPLARKQLKTWRETDDLGAFARWYGHLQDHWNSQRSHLCSTVWRPGNINLGAGSNYVPGWLNIDTDPRQVPDLVLDLAVTPALPLQARTVGGGQVELIEGSVQQIMVSAEPLGTERAARIFDFAFTLLGEGGELHWRLGTPIADDEHLEWMAPWTSRFWESGAFMHRLESRVSTKGGNSPQTPLANPTEAKLVLVKVATTLAERTVARMHLHDFGIDAGAQRKIADGSLGESMPSGSTDPDSSEQRLQLEPRSDAQVPLDPSDQAQVRVHVAYYRPDQLGSVGIVDPELFVPWNVEFNRGSRLLEFDLFKVLLDKAPSHRQYWGVFSWKFLGKSGMEADDVTRHIRAGVKAGSDVILLNPAVASNALFRNVFEQGQVCGHAHMEMVARATGLAPFVETLMRHDTFAMSSYVVGTRAFWHEYVDFAQAYLDGAEELVSRSPTFSSIFMGSAGYWRDPSFDYRPFMVERLLQVFLHLRRLKVRYMEPDEQLFRRKFGDEADALLRVYRLKQQATKSPQKASQWEAERQQWLTDRARLFRVFHLDDPLSQSSARDLHGVQSLRLASGPQVGQCTPA